MKRLNLQLEKPNWTKETERVIKISLLTRTLLGQKWHSRMKNKISWLIIICPILILGCAHLGKEEQASLEQKSEDLAFTGYKITVKVEAPLEKVEQYLMDFRSLNADAGVYKLKILNPGKNLRPGESAEGNLEISGIGFFGKITLVYYEPGQEIWLVFDGNKGAIGVVRYSFQQIGNSTKVTMKLEVGNLSYLLSIFGESEMKKAISAIVENVIINGQIHFNPSLKPEELLEKGYRGEFYQTFYQSHQASIWINSPLSKTSDYLIDPKTWEIYNQKYMIDIGQCLAKRNPEPCPIQLKLLGIDYKISSFQTSFKPEEETSAYWVSKFTTAKIQILLKPEQGGTRLTTKYVVAPPLGTSEQEVNFLLNLFQAPSYLEKIIINIKKDLEGPDLKISSIAEDLKETGK